LILSYFSTSGKGSFIKSKMLMPYHKIKSDASWGGNTLYQNLQFINYKSDTTYCG